MVADIRLSNSLHGSGCTIFVPRFDCDSGGFLSAFLFLDCCWVGSSEVLRLIIFREIRGGSTKPTKVKLVAEGSTATKVLVGDTFSIQLPTIMFLSHSRWTSGCLSDVFNSRVCVVLASFVIQGLRGRGSLCPSEECKCRGVSFLTAPLVWWCQKESQKETTVLGAP